jgi:hypothetical protein
VGAPRSTYVAAAESVSKRNLRGELGLVPPSSWMTYWDTKSVFWVRHTALSHLYSTPVQLFFRAIVQLDMVQSMS